LLFIYLTLHISNPQTNWYLSTLTNISQMKNLILTIAMLQIFTQFNFGQVLTNFLCYAVSEDNSPPNVLFEYDSALGEWKRIGETGGSNIEAIAIDPVSKIIYATDGGLFGTIDATTALFDPIGDVGIANGPVGPRLLDDIDGLTYDPINQLMYASHRVAGSGPSTNDLLFQIDVSTGSFVPAAMTDPISGTAVDYAVIPAVFVASFPGDVYDVDDIAYNSLTSELFALNSQDGIGVLTQLNPQTGEILRLVYNLPEDDVEGIGFNYLGELYGTTGNNGSTGSSNNFILIDYIAEGTSLLSPIDTTGVEKDFESFDCLSCINTNYSGCVPLILDNSQSILKNNRAIVYDYSNCRDNTNLGNCNPVVGFNNLAANEALWVVTKSAEYFLENYNIEIPQINIVVNNTQEPNYAKYNQDYNVIVLGVGDGIERNSMSAPDVVAHQYAHAIFNSIKPMGTYGIPGALNESYADIFAELIEQYCYGDNDWIWGSQVMAGNYNGIRNLSDPKDETMQYQMPDTHEGEYWTFINNICFDNEGCRVHINSGVHSYWFYLFANGGLGINDNGYNYNVNGIGIENAADIIFDNLTNYLNPTSSFCDVRTGSMNSVNPLFGNDSEISLANTEAWNAVSNCNFEIENPIKFRITNSEVFYDYGYYIEFDLNIDSLGMDLSADNLCFTLNLLGSYTFRPIDFFVDGIVRVYDPLTVNELSTVVDESRQSLTICINRLGQGAMQKKSSYPLIPSNSETVKIVVCIESKSLSIEPIYISGCTKIENDLICFEPATLLFDFDFDNEPQDRVPLSLRLNNKNCQTLGAIDVEVLDDIVSPIIYRLEGINNNFMRNFTSSNQRYQFYNLEEGDYNLEIVGFNRSTRKKFNIIFVAEQVKI